ncbi:hypothetical protein ABZ490_34030 [Streptomyces sp. NPDC005811]|uniref:VMAP-C domain-containing protein n=1 Tax=Streptomyces sp. NPDC005811 TaxID=3154565 RepID=UPI0033ED2B2E
MTVAARTVPRYLVDAVTEVRCLRDLDVLRQLVQRLCPALMPELDTTAGASRRAVVVSMMEDLCTRPAGISRLVEHLEIREGNSIPIRRLKVATASWEVELLDDEDWDELFDLLEGVRVPDLERRYSVFLYHLGRPTAPLPCTEPWTVFVHAATLNARPGEQLPCFQVLQQLLALGADGERQQRIVDWAERHDLFGPDDRGADTGFPPVKEPPAPERTSVWDPTDYLIIRLRPLLEVNSSSGHDTLLTHWLRVHPDGPVKGEEVRISLDEAEREVAALVRRVESDTAYRRTELALEFLLPRHLFALNVEGWRKASFQGVGGVLGEDHHVVVRSLERLSRQDLHGRWGRRWEAFTQGRAGRVHWFPEDGRSHLLSEPPPAVVVLSGPPDGARSGTGAPGSPDELVEALRAGAPVVIWDKWGDGGATFHTALRSLLGRKDPRRLPEVVRALRIASIDGDPEGDVMVGRHVALLWDDPNRMPVTPAGTSTVPPTDGEEAPLDWP